MSRQIDISNPENLSDEDRKYLEDRGRGNIVAHLDYMARVQAASDSLERKRLETGKFPEPTPQVVAEEVDEPYEKWTVEDLREELKNRQLPQGGNKSELVERLEMDDASA